MKSAIIISKTRIENEEEKKFNTPHRFVETRSGENEWRMVGEAADVDVILVDVLEVPHHLHGGRIGRQRKKFHASKNGGKWVRLTLPRTGRL